jgi:molybdopterin-guanine dinucleotide biosynthesis protein
MHDPFIIGVGGFTSSVGKTTLMCDLLRAFPGWEAIKTTRGHYRSCGKDAKACCVSHLLGKEPVVRSGREETYETGKDTGRYWDAGAANVHWLIATDDQIERGIQQALERVKTAGVFIEGNSFSEFVESNYFIMVRRHDRETIKKSARQILNKVSAIYLSHECRDDADAERQLMSLLFDPGAEESHPMVYTRKELPGLIAQLRAITSAATV